MISVERCRSVMNSDVASISECRGSATPLARRLLLCLACLSIGAVLALPRAAGASAVTLPVEQLYAALPQIMKAGKSAPFRQRYDVLAPVIDRVFDLEDILRISVGPQWATLPPEQQAALKEAFRRYTIASYVSNFDSFSGQRFEISAWRDGRRRSSDRADQDCTGLRRRAPA